jgi:hypothetical protein
MQYFFGGSNVLGEVKSQLGRTPDNPTLFFADSAPLIRFAPSVPFMPVVRSPQGDLCARINDALFIATDRLLPPLLPAAPRTKITKRTDNCSCLQQRSNGPRVQPPCNPRQTKLRNEATKPFHFNETRQFPQQPTHYEPIQTHPREVSAKTPLPWYIIHLDE